MGLPPTDPWLIRDPWTVVPGCPWMYIKIPGVEFAPEETDGDGDEDEGFESAVEEVADDDNDEEEDAMAHAAISIDSLLNW